MAAPASAAALPASSGGEDGEELVPLPLPDWFYPLCWHVAFPVARRAAMIEGLCVLPARAAPRSAMLTPRAVAGARRRDSLPTDNADCADPSAAAVALALEMELAHFASCISAEEYDEVAALEARFLGKTHDAWWLDSLSLRQLLLDRPPTRAPPAPPLADDDAALRRRDGRAVRFGVCARPEDARVHAEAFGDNSRDTLTRVLRAAGLPVLRHCTGAALLSGLYDTAGFRTNSWLWVEEEAGDTYLGGPLPCTPVYGVLQGVTPLPGLSDAAPAWCDATLTLRLACPLLTARNSSCFPPSIDNRLPPQMIAATARLFEAFQHTEMLHMGMLLHALRRVGASERAMPAPLGVASFARRLGDWVCNWRDQGVLDMETQRWAQLVEDGGALPCLLEWMITREIGGLASEAEWALLCRVCPVTIFATLSDTAATLSVARALCGAIRWMDAAPGGYHAFRGRAWGYVCSALLSLLTRTREGAPHELVSWAGTAAVAREIAMARWVPPASVARNWGYDPDVERNCTTTTCCALLRAARGVAAAIAAGKWQDHTADNVLREIGRLIRATAAVLSPSGSPLWDGELRTLWPEGALLEMMMDAVRDGDARVARWVLTYCLLPAGACTPTIRDPLALLLTSTLAIRYSPAYVYTAERRALRCGRTPEALQHCKCAKCVPSRDDGSILADKDASFAFEWVAVAAATAEAFPDCRFIAARTVAYAVQGASRGDILADSICHLQRARMMASSWPGGVAGEQRRDAAISALYRAPNRLALAGLRLQPPIRDDCDEADIIKSVDAARAKADAEGSGRAMSDDEDEAVASQLVPLLLDRALCALTSDGGADGRPSLEVATARAEAAAAALLAEEAAAKAGPAAATSAAGGKKKRPGSSARKRAAASGQAAPAAAALAESDDVAAADATDGALASRDDGPAASPEAQSAPSADDALAELFPWLALGPPAAQRIDPAHEDDALCIICLDADRDTPLPGCAAAHAPVLCAACAVAVCARAAKAVCPWCDAPCAGSDDAAA